MIGTEIQKAIYDALAAPPAVAGGLIYDAVPEGAGFPRVTIGQEQVLGDGNSCGHGWEVFSDVHIWSRETGFPEAKILASEVVKRILGIDELAGHSLVSVDFRDQRVLRDPDGLTSHVVCSFLFTVDEI